MVSLHPTFTTMLSLYGITTLCDLAVLVKHACRWFSGSSKMM